MYKQYEEEKNLVVAFRENHVIEYNNEVKKKFKTKAFASGCSREVIAAGADMLGWTLDELMLATLEAMKTFKE